MDQRTIVVKAVSATATDTTNLREDVWSIALDQRAFGPRRLLVSVTDGEGRFLAMAHTLRLDPPELALGPCLDHLTVTLGVRPAAAVAFCDEPVRQGPPPADLAERFD